MLYQRMVEEIEGPLGIWTYPVLNTIVAISGSNSDSKVETAKIIRDSNGEPQEVIKIKQ